MVVLWASYIRAIICDQMHKIDIAVAFKPADK